MDNFYKGNAIYNLIESTHSFRFTNENLWIVVYGNREAEPKVLILLSGYSNNDYESNTLTTKESEMLIYTKQISNKSKVPFLYVRYNYDSKKLYSLKIMVSDKINTVTMEEFVKILVGYGIQKNNRGSYKPINSKASNIYHLWQVNCGLDIITSDIDLMRVNSNLDITDVFELKRSFISIDKWEPFSNDYNNFILLSKLFNPCKIRFYLLFNQYYKAPYFDDINKLKVFKLSFENKLFIENYGLYTLSNFLLSFADNDHN
jgi:hypothetical protein